MKISVMEWVRTAGKDEFADFLTKIILSGNSFLKNADGGCTEENILELASTLRIWLDTPVDARLIHNGEDVLDKDALNRLN